MFTFLEGFEGFEGLHHHSLEQREGLLNQSPCCLIRTVCHQLNKGSRHIAWCSRFECAVPQSKEG